VNLKTGSTGKKDRSADGPAAERHELAILIRFPENTSGPKKTGAVEKP
jgi:hypothetical protein